MALKLYWKVRPEPTGRYRSFGHRGWPIAYYIQGGVRTDTETLKPAAFLYCEDDYVPSRVRLGDHKEIRVHVCHHQHPERGNSWKVFVLKRRAATLDEAKQMVQEFLEAHPDWHPKSVD